jgi:glycerol-3-phosphate dehydrogenase
VDLVAVAQPGELALIPGTLYHWVELRWAARREQVTHLDDLLLRRVRLGLLMPQGGETILPQVKGICQQELGWTKKRWEEETQAYRALWQRCYSLPDRAAIPNWHLQLAEAHQKRAHEIELQSELSNQSHLSRRKVLAAAGLMAFAAGLLTLFWLRRSKE